MEKEERWRFPKGTLFWKKRGSYQLVKMACDLWNSTKKVQFEFLHVFEPPLSFFYAANLIIE